MGLRLLTVAIALSAAGAVVAQTPRALDRDAERWVQSTLKKMSVEEKVGQMIVSSFQSNFMSTDSEAFETLVKAVHEQKVGGFHVFGGTEAVPPVLLNPTYGAVTLGQPFAAASILNRLQAISSLPLLNTGDFASVPAQLGRWTKAGGRDLPGLVRRRNAEGGR